jgi:hypothetical protein
VKLEIHPDAVPAYIEFIPVLLTVRSSGESVMATPTNKPSSPRGLVLVTGGSGYIAGYCIAQLLSDGCRVRTTVRDLGRAEQLRSAATNSIALAFAAISP